MSAPRTKLYVSPAEWNRGKGAARDYALIDRRTETTVLVTDDEKEALRERKRSRGRLRLVVITSLGAYRPVFRMRKVWSKRARRFVEREVLVGWTPTAEQERDERTRRARDRKELREWRAKHAAEREAHRELERAAEEEKEGSPS